MLLARFFIVFALAISLVTVCGAQPPSLERSQIASILAPSAKKGEFPNFLSVPDFGYAKATYTFDEKLHEAISKVYLLHRPDYASFVAIDPDTGKVLALSSFTRDQADWQNLALGSTYPAASIFKIITAAAVLDKNKASINTVIPFNGKSTTLYKRQTLKHKDNKYTRHMKLKEAFARSTNPVFGRLGVRQVGKEGMLEYIDKFGFDKIISNDLQVAESRFLLPLEDEWELAEAGSGYTRDIRIGPLHAATIMATIMNSGNSIDPYVLSSLEDKNEVFLYEASQVASQPVINEQAASDIMRMMRETVRIGSAKKSFRKAHRYKAYRGMDYGGKTGSLSGDTPKGRYDWFVGFAEKDGKRIAYASLIINKEKWYVKSSRVAFEVMNRYYKKSKLVATNP